MTTPNGPAPGWYDDPTTPGQLRYYDGAAWTESTSPAAPTSPPPAQHQPHGAQAPGTQPYGSPGYDTPSWQPPTAAGQQWDASAAGGVAVYGQPGPAAVGPGELGGVGDWLGTTFSTMFSRALPLGLLLMAPIVATVVAAAVAFASVSDVGFDNTTDEFVGFELAGLLAAGVLFAVAVVVSVVALMASTHLLYVGHLGRVASVGESVGVALRRLPRSIGWGLIGFLIIAVCYALVAALFTGLFAAGADVAVLIVLPIVFLVFIPVAIWIGVRQVFWSSAVVLDTSVNPFTASWVATRGRFWGLFGRMILLGIMANLISAVFQTVAQIVLTVALPAYFEVDPVTDDVIVNGQNLGELDVVRVADVVPGNGLVLVVIALFAMAQLSLYLLQISGTTALYARVNPSLDR